MAVAGRIENRFEPLSGVRRMKAFIKASEVVALGASATGEIGLWTVPQGATIIHASVRNGGTLVATLTTLTASLGINGATTAILGAETVHAANAIAITGVAVASEGIYASTAARAVVVEFTGNANLEGMTGASPGGFIVEMAWIERI